MLISACQGLPDVVGRFSRLVGFRELTESSNMTRVQTMRLLSILGAFTAGVWLPFRVTGFAPSHTLSLAFDLSLAFVSLMNIALYFSEERKSWRQPKSWLAFGSSLDLACVLILLSGAFAVEDLSAVLKWIVAFSIVRHLSQVRPFLDSFASLKPIAYRLIPLCIALPLVVHLAACGWLWLGSGSSEIDADHVLMYVKAIYWAFSTLTTVGYGDIVAKSVAQMLYACVVQLAGVGFFGFIVSNVASLLARSDAAREHHMDNLDRIETFMRLHRIPNDLRSHTRAYFHYMWTNKKGYQDSTLIEGLPAKIQSELLLHINKPIIERVSFLKDASSDLICDLMSELKPRVLTPGERVFKAGEAGDALYFIQSGNVEVISREGELITTLSEGAFFGEMALITNDKRSATTKATTFCDVFELHRASFDRVTSAYPEFRGHIEAVMKRRNAS